MKLENIKNRLEKDSYNEEGYNAYDLVHENGHSNTAIIRHHKSTMKLMCPDCYALYTADVKYDVNTFVDMKEDRNITLDMRPSFIGICPKCFIRPDGTRFIPLDYNIAEIISVLNKKGYTTSHCCEGHENAGDQYIKFAYNIINFDNMNNALENLPLGWKKEVDLISKHIIIRSKRYTEKNEEIDWRQNLIDLYLYVMYLPKLKGDI